jgi:predicted RNA-binding protein with PIN domain
MAYIVDGNNVMGQTPGWHRDKSKSRTALLQLLATFARTKKARVTAVFDGAPDSAFPEGSAYHGVRVLYAERGSDADTRIERLVETAPDPRGLTVVTSDRHMAFLVRSLGATVSHPGIEIAHLELFAVFSCRCRLRQALNLPPSAEPELISALSMLERLNSKVRKRNKFNFRSSR